MRARNLAPLARLATQRERDAALSMTRARQALEAARCRFAELRDYRNEYRQRFEDTCRAGFGLDWVSNYHEFLGSLDRAINGLAGRIRALERDCDQEREIWESSRNRARALDQAVARSGAEKRRAERRAEQLVLDELSSRLTNPWTSSSKWGSE